MQFSYYPLNRIQDWLLPKGRISYTENGLLMDWSACGFSCRFTGADAVLSFAPYHDEQAVYVMAILDGIRTKYAVRDGSERIILSAPDGEHTLTVLRLSEGGVPLICTQLMLRRFSAAPAPALLAAPAPSDRRIVFFGDSITCGFGNLGDPNAPFSTAEEDPTLSYAGQTAARLGAEAELVSISGQGIVRNCNGEVGTPIPLFYAWQSRSQQSPCAFEHQPDAVVINAGTNDGGGSVSKEAFYEGSAAFLRDVRRAYPHAPIVWFYGLMGQYYDEELRRLTEDLQEEIGNLHYLPIAPIYQYAHETGAVGHPSVEGASRGADVLTAELTRILGW